MADQVETMMETMRDLGYLVTPSDAERIVSAMTSAQTVSQTQGTLSVSPASSDAPATHVALARTRDPKIITQEQATGTRSA